MTMIYARCSELVRMYPIPRVKEAKGDEEAAGLWKASGADLSKFADFESPEDLKSQAEKAGVAFMV